MHRRLAVLVPILLTSLLVALPGRPASAGTIQDKVKERLKEHNWLSSGFTMWLDGPQEPPPEQQVATPQSPSFGTNVDANDPAKDFASGQSETSIAAVTSGSQKRVLVGWNDATGFLFHDSTVRRGSLTGVGYSKDGGATFKDLTGLPNDDPAQQWSGDPSIVAIDGSHFVVASLYFPSFTACQTNAPSRLSLALSVATASSTDAVTFTNPIEPVPLADICTAFGKPAPPSVSLLDKEWVAYDPATRTLAVAYVRFILSETSSGLGQIEVVRAHVPANPADLSPSDFGKRVVVWKEEPFCGPNERSSEGTQCGALQEGPFPVVTPNGDTYVFWERNLETYLFNGDPLVYMHAAKIPAGATAPSVGGRSDPIVVSKGQVEGSSVGGTKPLGRQFIEGYNRFPPPDFPQAAYNPVSGKLDVVWADSSRHPLGDVFLREVSLNLRTLGATHKVNDDSSFALHFLPAISVGTNGAITTSWHDRRLGGADSTITDYFGETRANIGAGGIDYRITTGSTDWSNTSTLIVPNFGDYTDSGSDGTRVYFTWSDGRIGVPQPFADHHG